MVKKRKSGDHHWILHIQFSLGTKFQLTLTIIIFLTKFGQKGFFWSKTEKANTTYFLHNSAYSNQSSAKFQLKRTILLLLVFGPNLPKKVLPVENRKSEHHHEILDICISLDTKFQLKLIILRFQTKFTQKKVFPVENCIS